MRAASSLVVALSLFLPYPALPAAQAADKEACVKAFDSAQKNRSTKKLRAAKKDALVCVQEGCPAIVKKDCDAILSDVDASIPTLVLSAKDGHGNDIIEVRVTLDGELLTEKLDGSAVAIDPGPHTIHWEAAGVPPQDSKILVKEAEKNRNVSVTLGASTPPPPPPPEKLPPPPPAAPPSKSIPTATWILGGVGVVGLASFAYFGLKGRSEVDDLKQQGLGHCAPACDPSVEDPAKHKLLIADVSLGVGLVSLGLATYFLVSNTPSEAPKPAALRVDATPVAGGGYFQLMGRF